VVLFAIRGAEVGYKWSHAFSFFFVFLIFFFKAFLLIDKCYFFHLMSNFYLLTFIFFSNLHVYHTDLMANLKKQYMKNKGAASLFFILNKKI